MKNELEKKITELIKNKGSKKVIYDNFNLYEDIYSTIKNPTAEEQNEYIKLYFLYIGYMEKREN